MTGSNNASHCVTQPIYTTVTDNIMHRLHHEKTASDKFPD